MLKRTKVSVVALLICSFFFSVVPVRADVPSEQRYAGEILPGVMAVSSDSETVSYTRREVTATGAEKGAPDYHNMENLPNCCGRLPARSSWDITTDFSKSWFRITRRAIPPGRIKKWTASTYRS